MMLPSRGSAGWPSVLSVRALVLAGGTAFLSPAAAAAAPQAAAATPSAPPAASAPQASTPVPPPAPFTAGWNNGFALQSPDGDYRLTLGALAQTDGRFSIGDPLPVTNTFVLRKARVIVAGRVARFFDFRIMPDFGNGAPTLQDAYLDIRFSPAFRIRTGKDKTPFGYELLVSDAALLFPERSLVSALVPNRDIGVQALGELGGGRLTYSGGLFNGVPDGASTTTEADTNSDKDFAGRVAIQPFRTTGRATVLSGLGLHLGGTIGTQSGSALPSARTSAGQTFFSYDGTSASGTRTRITPALFYSYKRVGAFAEYVRTSQALTKGAVSRRVANEGWDVTGSLVLTGEAASSGLVRPSAPFDPGTGRWGAVQLVLRHAELTFDAAAFDAGFAAAAASRRARQFSVGINWYPVSFVKYYATVERTAFDPGDAPARPVEHVVIVRAQFAF
jgi:phosphate-selective porin OprO/OprP